MKKMLSLCILLFIIFSLSAQDPGTNYDESKVPVYTLPDPLIFNNGSKVRSKKEWAKRHDEIFKIFENEVYGTCPDWKGTSVATEISANRDAFDGKAERKEIKLTLKNGSKMLDIMILIYLPHSSKPVPVFLGYNFGGNHTVSEESDIMITSSWMRKNDERGVVDNRATEAGRGKDVASWPVREIISRGYGVATIYAGDVDPDFDDGFRNGVHGLFNEKRTSSSWGTISAWSWGLSRAMDYLETNPAIDPKRVIVIGHSRLGKTALWAGASDKRFSIVVSNNSGCGGAALSNRKFGETVGRINSSFPHWFCDNFNKYSEKEETLPVDQHELIALIAPRPVYVASAEDDKWADPRGEYLSCVNATPVYTILGLNGLPGKEMPLINSPVIGTIGYHIRSGGHAITLYDWMQYCDFADLHLGKK